MVLQDQSEWQIEWQGALAWARPALALGAAGPLYEALAVKSWQEFWPGAQQRAAQMLETAADEGGWDAEELADRIASSEQAQLQTAIAVSAAERTTWPPQIKALGKVLADGLMAEGDAIDLPQFALDAMTELGRLHVSLLELLVRYEPGIAPDGTSPRPYVAAGGGWMAGRRSWAARATVQHRPQLRSVLSSVVGTLVRHGLAEQTDRTPRQCNSSSRTWGCRSPPEPAGSSAVGRPRSWVSVCSGTIWRPAPTPQPRMSREHCPHDPFGNRSPRSLG